MPNVSIKGPRRQRRTSPRTGQALFCAPCFENLKSFNVSHCVTSVTACVGGEVCQSRIGRIPLPVGLLQSMPLPPPLPPPPSVRPEAETSSPIRQSDARTCHDILLAPSLRPNKSSIALKGGSGAATRLHFG